MPYYLRKVRKAKWLSENVRWLAQDDIQADALVDLSTKANELSVYRISDEKDYLDQIIVALALTCEHISNVDFALVKEEDLEKLQIKVSQSQGITPDDTVNSRHYDLCELSAQKVINLAQIIRSGEISRFTEPNVRRKAAQALIERRIDRTKVGLLQESLVELEEMAERMRSAL